MLLLGQVAGDVEVRVSWLKLEDTQGNHHGCGEHAANRVSSAHKIGQGFGFFGLGMGNGKHHDYK